MPFAERGGAKLFYEDKGSGAPVIFSHGLLMDHEMFAPQVEALQDRYRCLAWDERAHSATESEGPFSYWDSAADLFAILDDAGIDRAVLVGMSQGGFLSLRAALIAPERVLGLFLIDTQAGTENPNAIPFYAAMLDEWEAKGPQTHFEDAIAAAILGPMDAEPWRQKWRAMPVPAVRRAFDALCQREDLTDRLSEIAAPAVVVHGDADASIPMARAEALAAGLPGCEGVVAIAGGGHASNLSHPAEVTPILESFLAIVTPA